MKAISAPAGLDRRAPKKPRQKKKKNPVLVMQELKIIFILIIVLFLVCFFWFWSVDITLLDINDFVNTVHTSQATLLAEYQTALEKSGTYTSSATTLDMSGWYVDAEGNAATYLAGAEQTVTGITFSVNHTTHEYGEHAYIINIRELMLAEYSDIIAFEESIGVTGHESVETYVDAKLSAGNYIYTGDSVHYTSTELYGAVGPAVTTRNFFENAGWEEANVTMASYFDYAFGGSRDAAKVDMMLVKTDEVEAYYAGESVDVTYVYFNILDVKAHGAPWGIGQTYIHFLGNSEFAGTRTSSGGDTDQITFDADALTTFTAMYNALKSSQSRQYWWPTILATESDLGLNIDPSVSLSYYRVTKGTHNIFEVYGQHNQYFQALFPEYSLVGILVYATNESWYGE